MGTLEATKIVAHKWLWVLADQLGSSHQFEQVLMHMHITKITFCIFAARMIVFEMDAVPQSFRLT